MKSLRGLRAAAVAAPEIVQDTRDAMQRTTVAMGLIAVLAAAALVTAIVALNRAR